MFSPHGCVCTRCMSGDCRSQKSVPDPLKMELPTMVIHHVGSRNSTWILF